MKKAALLPLLAFLTPLFAALSLQAAPRESLRADCIRDVKDRYDLGWAYPRDSESQYRGQCIDTSIKRPTILLDVTEAGIRFANFFYKGRYYTATIPDGAVERIYFQIAEFDKILGVIQPAHTQLRFILKKGKPARLVSQSGASKIVSLRDFVFSSDYMAPKGVPYDAMRGFHPVFMSTSRFVSTADRVDLQIRTNGNRVRQFELNIKGRARDQILWAAISWADQRRMRDVYHTISMNCTTEAFRMLYLGLELPVPRNPWTPGSILDPIVGSSLRRLTSMGLIDSGSERQSLNEEFGL